MSLNVPELISLLNVQGRAQYGMEAVNQMEHALQCAYLAERANETPATIAAALLHDLGHLIAAQKDGQIEHDTSQDDLHQYVALPFLRGTFPDAVLEPIRMHVDAKRYLCAVDANYWPALSIASKHSLEQQGGVYSEDQVALFLAQPFAEEAIRLRRYDDLAKIPELEVPDLAHFEVYLKQVELNG